jgi:hypothetical protein
MGEMRNSYKIVFEYLKGRDHMEDLGTDRWIILEWILAKQCGRCGLDSSGSG